LEEATVKRSTDRILTTHVGSLVRPPEVVGIMRGREPATPFSPDELATLDREVQGVVRTEAEIGIDIPSDGEYSKSSFSGYIQDRLTGFQTIPGRQGRMARSRDRARFREAYAEIDQPLPSGAAGGGSGSGGAATGTPTAANASVCVGPISYRGQELLEQDIARFKTALQGKDFTEAFIPAVGPATIELQRDNDHYATEEEYLFAIADAMKTEYKMIVDAGFILQIDDPRVVTEYDSLDPAPTPEEYRKFAAVRIEALNQALAGLPEDRIRFHMCWGSWHGPHTTDAPLREIADVILQVRAGAFSLEAANPRHEHEYHFWEEHKFPEGKIIIPGVISHVTNHVEHPELIAERITRYARIVGRENVIASTDCGFAQGAFTQRVHPSIMWEKLRMLTEGARLASQRLWG
jgi:5-methyltetrahydropteroyltriglutamate--homocysteine methyltransferase